MKKLILWFSWGYTLILISGSLAGLLIGFNTTYGDISGSGCNFYDALFYGINCRGFFGAQAIEVLVGFPLLVAQVSVALCSSLIGVMFALLLWFPVLISLYSFFKHQKSRSKRGAATPHLQD